jgi:hypothetical protein
MNKKEYIAPILTVVTFKVEQGYATSYQSTTFLDLFTIEATQDYNDQAQENWHESSDFGDRWN